MGQRPASNSPATTKTSPTSTPHSAVASTTSSTPAATTTVAATPPLDLPQILPHHITTYQQQQQQQPFPSPPQTTQLPSTTTAPPPSAMHNVSPTAINDHSPDTLSTPHSKHPRADDAPLLHYDPPPLLRVPPPRPPRRERRQPAPQPPPAFLVPGVAFAGTQNVNPAASSVTNAVVAAALQNWDGAVALGPQTRPDDSHNQNYSHRHSNHRHRHNLNQQRFHPHHATHHNNNNMLFHAFPTVANSSRESEQHLHTRSTNPQNIPAAAANHPHPSATGVTTNPAIFYGIVNDDVQVHLHQQLRTQMAIGAGRYFERFPEAFAHALAGPLARVDHTTFPLAAPTLHYPPRQLHQRHHHHLHHHHHHHSDSPQSLTPAAAPSPFTTSTLLAHPASDHRTPISPPTLSTPDAVPPTTTAPLPAVPPTAPATETDAWRVNVRITSVDMDRGVLSGTMEAHDVPKTNSPVITFWAGEIVDNANFYFRTGRWDATRHNDMEHWSRFPGFDPQMIDAPTLGDAVRYSPPTTKSPSSGQYIYMRWKESHFENAAADCGLTIAGFYYICMHRATGSLVGYYYDPYSAPFQKLDLRPTTEQRAGFAFAEYSFN